MKQPIGSRLHGIVDYATGASLLATSRLPVLRNRFAGTALLATGASVLAYSALTDYELGAVRKLPYKAHLAIDAASGLGLVVLGALRSETLDRLVLAGVGLQELAAVALSDPSGQGA